MTIHRVLVILADGFEEIETITILDVLRRANIDTVAAGLASKKVTGAHHVTVQSDALLADINPAHFTMIVLPGGQPGTTNLGISAQVTELVQEFAKTDRYVAAICAAPMVLAQVGLLNDVKAVCYPGCEPKMEHAIVVDQEVCQSGKIITGRGPAAAMAFALKLVEALAGEKESASVAEDLLYQK